MNLTRFSGVLTQLRDRCNGYAYGSSRYAVRTRNGHTNNACEPDSSLRTLSRLSERCKLCAKTVLT